MFTLTAKMASAEAARDSAVTDTCLIEATVPTGFESVAAEEAKEQFNTECRSARGKIRFETPTERVTDILNLGGIDHCRAQIFYKEYFGFTPDGDDCLTRLQLMVKECNWTEGLAIWSKFYSFSHPVSSQPDVVPTDEELIDICYSKHMPGHKVHAPGGHKKAGRRDRRKGGRKDKGEQKESKQEEDKKDEAGGEDKESEVLGAEGPEECVEAEAYRPYPCESDAVAAPEDKPPQHDGDAGDGIGTGVSSCENASKESLSKLGPTSSSDPEEGPEESAVSPVKEMSVPAEGDSDLLSPSRWPDHEDSPTMAPQPESPVKDSEGESSVDPKGPDAEAAKSESGSGAKPQQTRRPKDPSKPSFRVTCKRTGEDHSFDSMSAAASFGSAVQKYFGWNVDMTDYDIEVVLTIDNNEVSVGLALTPESLHKRNLVAFGVTTLRPTICHNMLRMVKVLPGHVVCDPMCGTGSISIQGALRFPAFQLCGDNYSVPMEKTAVNKEALNAKRAKNGSGGLMMDAVKWDACNLPLRDGVVDVFVSDLPFGKSFHNARMGRRFNNRKLYCDVLDEMARCGKQKGRAALLTGDINHMMKAIQGQNYWSRRRVYSCNIGGIAAAVFLLFRNPVPYHKRGQASASQPDSSQPTCSGPSQDEAGPPILPEEEQSEDNGLQQGQGSLTSSQGGCFESSPSGQGEECGSSVDTDFSMLTRDGFDQFSDGADMSKPAAAGDTTDQSRWKSTIPTTKDVQLADDEDARTDAAVSGTGDMTNNTSSSSKPTVESGVIKTHHEQPATENGVSSKQGAQRSNTSKPHTAVESAAEGDGWMESNSESSVDADVHFTGVANHHHHYHHHHHHHYHICGSPSQHPHGPRGGRGSHDGTHLYQGGGLHVKQEPQHHGSRDIRDNPQYATQDRRDYTHYPSQDHYYHPHHGNQDIREQHPHFIGHGGHVCQDGHQVSRDHTHHHAYGDKESYQLGRKDPRVPFTRGKDSHLGPGAYASHYSTREGLGHPGSNRGAFFSHRGVPYGVPCRGSGSAGYRDGRLSNREGQPFGRGTSRDRGNSGRYGGGGGKTRKKSKDREEKEICGSTVPAEGQGRHEPQQGSGNPNETAPDVEQGSGGMEETRKALNESSNRTSDGYTQGDQHDGAGSRIMGPD